MRTSIICLLSVIGLCLSLKCNSGSKKEGDKVSVMVQVGCSFGKCVKSSVTMRGKTEYRYDCGSNSTCNVSKELAKKGEELICENEKNCKVTVSCCDKDLCNGATTAVQSVFVVSLVAFITTRLL